LSATAQDQRDLDNPLVRFAHFERQRLEAATPAATPRRNPPSRS
jgi:hypothetical protein